MKTNRQKQIEGGWTILLHMSCVTCHMSCVLCHLSLTPTSIATDSPLANSPTMHSRLVFQDPKTKLKKKIIETVLKLTFSSHASTKF